METQLQQRIVGATVLVMLGVIFIPALLDGSGYKSRQVQEIEVREKPAFSPLTQNKLAPLAPIDTPLEAIKIQQNIVLQADPEQAHKKEIKSFALKVGTFSRNENAEQFRKTLMAAGYAAFIQPAQANGKKTYRVKIGPELERSVLNKWKKELRKSHQVDAYVVNHP